MADVSFKTDILPLFTQTDIDHMAGFGVDLDKFEYMSDPQNAQNVYVAIETKSMPPGEPWSEDKIALLKSWMDGGYKP